LVKMDIVIGMFLKSNILLSETFFVSANNGTKESTFCELLKAPLMLFFRISPSNGSVESIPNSSHNLFLPT